MDLELRRQQRLAMRGVPERLGLSFTSGNVEMRAKPNGTAAGSNFEWSGYAAVYDHDFPMWDPHGEPYTEWVAQGACKRSLSNPNLDVPFLIGHDSAGIALARTKSGTMKLSEDAHGMHVHVPSMDGSRADVQALASAVARGDQDEMSLAFVCNQQAWDDGFERRGIMEMDLHRGDVCSVVHGANDGTAGAWMSPAEMLSFRRPAAIGGPVLLERWAMELLSVPQAERDKAKAAGNSLPDGSYPINNTTQLHSAATLAASHHGDWQAAQTLIRRRAKELGVDVTTLPGFAEEKSAGMPVELRASAADDAPLAAAPDYDAAAAAHPPMTGTHAHVIEHSHTGDNNHGTSAGVAVDDSTGIPGDEVQLTAARNLELMMRELELEELARR